MPCIGKDGLQLLGQRRQVKMTVGVYQAGLRLFLQNIVTDTHWLHP